MTGRTHDLAAFTAVNFLFANSPLLAMSLGTLFIAFTANLIGGLTPDIDQPTAALWHKIPGGTLYSRLITPFFGGHRYISHSILGVVLFGFLADKFLQLTSHTIIVNQTIVWWAFMIAYISHLFMDLFTKEGIPLFFPIPLKIGLPPFSFLRITTGGITEKYLIFPLLIILNAIIMYSHYGKYLSFFHTYIH